MRILFDVDLRIKLCPASPPGLRKGGFPAPPAVEMETDRKYGMTIRRATRKQYSVEEKIRIVLDGLRGEHSIAELCRCKGGAESLYYNWSKDFLEAGKRRLAGDTARAATSSEVRSFAARRRS